MNKRVAVQSRIDVKLKEEVEDILHQLGLTTAAAIEILFKQIKRKRGLPFEMVLPEEWDETQYILNNPTLMKKIEAGLKDRIGYRPTEAELKEIEDS